MLILGLCLWGLIYGCAGERKYQIKIDSFESKAFVGGLVEDASVELTAYNATATCISGFLELIGMIPTEAMVKHLTTRIIFILIWVLDQCCGI